METRFELGFPDCDAITLTSKPAPQLADHAHFFEILSKTSTIGRTLFLSKDTQNMEIHKVSWPTKKGTDYGYNLASNYQARSTLIVR